MNKEHENDVMRKALEKIRFEIESYFFGDEGVPDSHEKVVDSFLENPPDYVSLRNTFFEIDQILRDYRADALPLKNCEVGNAEEQSKRFNKFCHAHKELVLSEYRCSDDCPCLKTLSSAECEMVWSQMSYKDEKQ